MIRYWLWRYCGIFRLRGDSVILVSVGGPLPRIYILDEIKIKKSFLTETENRRIHEITFLQINKKPQSSKIAPPQRILMIPHLYT